MSGDSNGLAGLRAGWLSLFGAPAPAGLRSRFLEQAIAWKRQVIEAGDVSPAVRRDLAVALTQQRQQREGGPVSRPLPPPASGRLTPGTQLIKAWRGEVHVVDVEAGGFRWQGGTYRSLSALAKEITATHWNGLLFFGLRERGPKPPRAARIADQRRKSANAPAIADLRESRGGSRP